MISSHIEALQEKKAKLDKQIHDESLHAARNDALIEDLKKQKLKIKEEISRLENELQESAA